jgi:hypothetical protein
MEEAVKGRNGSSRGSAEVGKTRPPESSDIVDWWGCQRKALLYYNANGDSLSLLHARKKILPIRLFTVRISNGLASRQLPVCLAPNTLYDLNVPV